MQTVQDDLWIDLAFLNVQIDRMLFYVLGQTEWIISIQRDDTDRCCFLDISFEGLKLFHHKSHTTCLVGSK